MSALCRVLTADAISTPSRWGLSILKTYRTSVRRIVTGY